MSILGPKTDEQVKTVYFTKNALVVDLMDGRTISVPLTWYPKLLNATRKQRSNWEVCSGGFGIHWSEIDEDLSTEGLLRGSPSPQAKVRNGKKLTKAKKSRQNSRPRLKRKIQS
jgi:hypothetical protein